MPVGAGFVVKMLPSVRQEDFGWFEWVSGLLSFAESLSVILVNFTELIYQQNNMDLLRKASRSDRLTQRLTRKLKRVPMLGNWLVKTILK